LQLRTSVKAAQAALFRDRVISSGFQVAKLLNADRRLTAKCRSFGRKGEGEWVLPVSFLLEHD